MVVENDEIPEVSEHIVQSYGTGKQRLCPSCM